MSTLLITIRTEARRMLRGGWLLPLWFAFFVLCAGAAWNGMAWVEARQTAVASILEDEADTHAMRRKQLVEEVRADNRQRYGGALYATAFSLRATLAPGALAVLTVGQAEGYPMAANISPFAASNTIFDQHTAGMENPSVLAAGRFDLAFVLVWLLPLLVLAGSFDLFATERERGMGPWLLSQPVSPARLLVSKALARALLLILPLVAILVGVLWMTSTAGPGALLSVAGLVLLYGLFWLALALLVNLFATTAAQAALGCLAGWLALAVLLPALALGVADLAAPPSNPNERANALRAEAMRARAEMKLQPRAVVIAPGNAAPNIPDSLRRRAVEVARAEVLIQEALQPYRAQDRARQAWLNSLRAASPAIALQDGLERLADADAARARHFQVEAHGFLLQVRAIANQYLAQDRLLTVADYDRGLPRFVFRGLPARDELFELLFDAAVIAFGAALLLAFAYLRLRHPIHLTE
jgi:ABC-2 type transport system permease protein